MCRKPTAAVAVLASVLASVLGTVLATASPSEAARGTRLEDQALLLWVAEGRSLPRRIAPRRRDHLDRVVGHLRLGQKQAALDSWHQFCAGYFPGRAEDVNPILRYVLRESYVVPRRDGERITVFARTAAYLDARARAARDYLGDIEQAAEEARRGARPLLRPLKLGPPEYRALVEPAVYSRAQAFRKSDLRKLHVSWSDRAVAAREDAVMVHREIQGFCRRNPKLLREVAEAWSVFAPTARQAAVTGAR